MGWWNALDGKNGWREFDTVIVLTLLYRPESVALNIFQAVQGPLATDSLTAPPDVVQEIREGQIAVDVVQAINRVRCRAVTRPDGRCEPTDIWVRYPDTVRLVDPDRILDGLRLAMPGLAIRPWDLGGAGSGSRLRNQYENRLIETDAVSLSEVIGI